VEIAEIAEPVREYLNRFEIEFISKFQSTVPLADEVVRYLSGKRGKRLRPLLVFLSASLHGDMTLRTMSAAVVVEMFHTATLIHDDVVDESHLRRGVRTVNDIWDNRISILIGDLLFSKTLASIVDLQDNDAVAILASAAERITEGELLQIAYRNTLKLDEGGYFDLIAKKTAALFNVSCQLGAMTVGEKGSALSNMAAFGENYGIAFQIMDDLLDYVGHVETLGKPTGSDLREGKITLPLIYALDHAAEEKRAEVMELLNQGIQSEKHVQQIILFTKDHGGIHYAKAHVQTYTEKALKALDVYPDSPAKRSLIELVALSTNRNT
jgi:octaprenyl-diphosphate synthase